jgi:hypothetical protein
MNYLDRIGVGVQLEPGSSGTFDIPKLDFVGCRCEDIGSRRVEKDMADFAKKEHPIYIKIRTPGNRRTASTVRGTSPVLGSAEYPRLLRLPAKPSRVGRARSWSVGLCSPRRRMRRGRNRRETSMCRARGRCGPAREAVYGENEPTIGVKLQPRGGILA